MEATHLYQHFFLICITGLAIFIGHQYSCDAKVVMEYIGATGKPVSFLSVPIRDGIDFHFILSFAIDADSSGKPQNGIFSPYWLQTLTPDSVADIKKRHPNIRALASLAGWSIDEKEIIWYNPQEPKIWISNAFSSLRDIISKYNLDGIDIDYENFPKNDNSTTFGYCIGELITQLKNQKVITVATIAPYYLTAEPYFELYKRYEGVIDYVNYQFYTDKKAKTPELYLKDYGDRAEQFGKEKLLPSYEVDGRGIQGDGFFDALSLLEKNGFAVNGVMIFSADASASGESEYYYEAKSQDFLLKSGK